MKRPSCGCAPPAPTMNCQKCRTPLKLDLSLQGLNIAASDLLISTEMFCIIMSDERLTSLQAPRVIQLTRRPAPHDFRILRIERRSIMKRPSMLFTLYSRERYHRLRRQLRTIDMPRVQKLQRKATLTCRSSCLQILKSSPPRRRCLKQMRPKREIGRNPTT